MKNKNFIEKLEHDNNPVVPGLVSNVEYLKLNLPPVFFLLLPFKSVSLSLLSRVYMETMSSDSFSIMWALPLRITY